MITYFYMYTIGTADYRVKSEALQYECGVEVSV